jgi:synaptobrevin family protein YKT6
MKITALLVMKVSPAPASSTVLLANASDVSQFGFFQRPSAKEFIVFASRTIAGRTPLGQRQSVEQDEYVVHCYNRNGLCGLAFVDKEYPLRSAFSVINKVLDEYQTTFGDSWKIKTTDCTDAWPYLPDALVKFQNPTEADKLAKIQKDLDETKVILHKTIDSVLARGERLDTLVDKSADLSSASQMFYKQAKKANQCCTIL